MSARLINRFINEDLTCKLSFGEWIRKWQDTISNEEILELKEYYNQFLEIHENYKILNEILHNRFLKYWIEDAK